MLSKDKEVSENLRQIHATVLQGAARASTIDFLRASVVGSPLLYGTLVERDIEPITRIRGDPARMVCPYTSKKNWRLFT